MSAARMGVARVLGIDPSTLRADTPLSSLGWDSLARICWVDVVAEDGWRGPADLITRASTIGDLADGLARREGTP
jgi:acyl carrier protein